MSSSFTNANSAPAETTIYWINDLFRKHKVMEHSDCSDGCHYCCHQIVSLTVFDAIRVTRGIDTLSDDKKRVVRKNAIANVVANNNAKTDAQRWKRRLPCSLLNDGRCLIYENRPIPCLATTSIDREFCISQYEDKKTAEHLTASVAIDGFSAQGILDYQTSYASRDEYDELKMKTNLIQNALRIDLDRLVEYYSLQDSVERSKRLEKLCSYDRSTIELLTKVTE